MSKQETWTAAQAADYLNKKKSGELKVERAKFGNVWVVVDGIRFQSKKEAKYYGLLKMRVKAGNLLKFEMQVTYPLIVNGHKITEYRADFVLYHPNESKTVVDVKGEATLNLAEFRIKRALMWAIYKIKVQTV